METWDGEDRKFCISSEKNSVINVIAQSALVHGYENVDNTTIAQYSVSTIIDSFVFWNYKVRRAYHGCNNLLTYCLFEQSRNIVTGWNTAALCGGFCFFLYILQTMFMFFVGLSLENDSVILGGINFPDIIPYTF